MKHLRFTALILALFTVFSLLTLFGQAEQTELTVVIACSDFQEGSHTGSTKNVLAICQKIKEEYPKADGFFCNGDYDRNTIGDKAASSAGLRALKSTVRRQWQSLKEENMLFCQGNHDIADTTGLATTGSNDPASGKYGVFLINEDDYPQYQGQENGARTRVKEISQELAAYLEDKSAKNFTAPIFIVTHLPLHFTMRSAADTDNAWADYLFNVLNEAGARGLNIIYTFGHNHSHGWDNYLGGSCVFLNKGDEIVLSKGGSTQSVHTETLNFYYMNSGYVGYYDVEEEQQSAPVDRTLTMSVFAFDDETLKITRFSSEGVHNLKSEGVYNLRANGQEQKRGLYKPQTQVYESPLTISLKQDAEPEPEPSLTPTQTLPEPTKTQSGALTEPTAPTETQPEPSTVSAAEQTPSSVETQQGGGESSSFPTVPVAVAVLLVLAAVVIFVIIKKKKAKK